MTLLSNPSLPLLWTKARQRQIRATEIGVLLYSVTSSKHDGTVYEVDLERGTCQCFAGWLGKPCMHFAWAAAEEFYHLWSEWNCQEKERFIQERYRVRTDARFRARVSRRYGSRKLVQEAA